MIFKPKWVPTRMNNNPAHQIPQAHQADISRLPKRYRMSQEDRDALFREGELRYRQPFIRRGERDRCIYAVGFYLFQSGYGYGREDERLELLTEWFFDRRTARSAFERKCWEGALYRAVHWKPAGWKPMSDELIERLTEVPDQNLESFWYGNLKSWNGASLKIAAAKRRLEEQSRPVGVKALARESGCDHKTVARHRAEWDSNEFPRVGTVITPNRGMGVVGSKGCEKKEALEIKKAKQTAFGTGMVTDNPPAGCSAPAILPDWRGLKNDALDRKTEVEMAHKIFGGKVIMQQPELSDGGLTSQSSTTRPSYAAGNVVPLVPLDPVKVAGDQKFDVWLKENQQALRKRLYRLREKRPELIKVRDMALISHIYHKTGGAPVTEA